MDTRGAGDCRLFLRENEEGKGQTREQRSRGQPPNPVLGEGSWKAFMQGLVLPVVLGEENKATLLELGAVEPLTKLLTHEDKIVRRNAMMIFGILASNSE